MGDFSEVVRVYEEILPTLVEQVGNNAVCCKMGDFLEAVRMYE